MMEFNSYRDPSRRSDSLMPVLPSGYFFRVKKPHWITGNVTVELRKHGRKIGLTCPVACDHFIDSRTIPHHRISKHYVREAMRILAGALENARDAAKLYGDYPPKTL